MICCILFAFTACDELNGIEEPFTMVIPVGEITANGLEIDTKNGGIEVYYWNESFIKVEGEKRVNGLGNLESEIEKISVNYAVHANQLHIYASFPDDINKLFKNVSYGVSMIVYIPEETNKFSDYEMNTSNGSITLSGFDGHFDLRTSNGSIELSDVNGQIDITTSNGPIKFSNLFLTESTHSFDTSNGSIKGSVTFPLSGNVRLVTSNGSIDLSVPSNTAADFVANTSNGGISINGLPVTYTSDDKTSKMGRINNGGVRLEMKTSNGSINVAQ